MHLIRNYYKIILIQIVSLIWANFETKLNFLQQCDSFDFLIIYLSLDLVSVEYFIK